MTQPNVIITEQDGALGVLPPSQGRLLAIVGPTTSGTPNKPSTYARVVDLVAAYGGGPAVEAAAHYIDVYGRPVLFVKSDANADGMIGDLTSSANGGTSAVTVGGEAPVDDFDLVLKIIAEGTVGTAGITYKLSYDGGRSFGPTIALGTDNSVEVPDSGDLTFELGTGTLKIGATYSVRTSAPNFEDGDLKAALDALAGSAASWELCLLAGTIDADLFDTIDGKFQGMFNAGSYHGWLANARMPDQGEDEADYLDALATAFDQKATKRGSVYAGACRLSSAISGRKYRRPAVFAAGAREGSVSEEIDIADVNLGPLPVSIRDANGNPDPDCHDESLFPGLDDARFGTLRTWGEGANGVYVNRPRIMSSEGSDFQLMPHRRVMDLTHNALRSYFIRRLNKPIRVNRTTGFILESEALEIEAGADAVMRSVLLAKPKASDVQFQLSRVDNLLSTKTLHGTARVLPLAYPEFIELDVGFVNPALLVQAA